MFCSQCGTKNADEAKFCKQCGHPLQTAVKKESTVVLQEKQPEESASSISTEQETPISELSNTEAEIVNNEVETIPEISENTLETKEETVETTSKVEEVDSTVQIVNENQPTINVEQQTVKTKNKASKKTGILVGIIVAIVVVIAIIVALLFGSKKTINLNKYLTLESTGFEGYGRVQAIIDWEAIEKKYGDSVSFTTAAKNEYGGFLAWYTPIGALQDSVDLDIENNQYLSNGDTVTYTWDIEDDLEKYFTCKIKYKDGAYKVSGLEKIGTFDAFEDLEVTYEGIAPNGKLNLVYNGYELNVGSFQADKYTNLKNGDVVKITIDESNLERYAQELGKIPSILEKEYTVSGLESYATSRNEITDVALQQMKQQAEDVFQAEFAKRNTDEGEALESLTCIGDYFLVPKGDRRQSVNNYYYLVYKVQVHNSYENKNKSYDKINEYYWFVQYSDLMVAKDGSINLEVTDFGIPGRSFYIDSQVDAGWWSTKRWHYYGYESLDALCKDNVTIKLDYYNCETNIDESVAPQIVEVSPDEVVDGAEEDYILPNSSTEIITVQDLEGLTEQEIKIARNEIYARHGRKFKDDALRAYFESKDWYHGTINPDDFQENDLTDIEIKNKDTIVAFEKSRGYNR